MNDCSVHYILTPLIRISYYFITPQTFLSIPAYKSPAATTPAPAATAAKFHDPVAAAPVLELGDAPPVVDGVLSPVLLGEDSPPVEEAEPSVEDAAEDAAEDAPEDAAEDAAEDASEDAAEEAAEEAAEDAAEEDGAAEDSLLLPPLLEPPALTREQISAVRARVSGRGLAGA